jgi:hypothetical protein
MLAEFLFGKRKKQKKIKAFSGTVNRKRITVYAKSPASAARLLYKKVPNFKSKGVRKIIVKNAKGKLFTYRVKLVKANTQVNYEGSTSVKYKYFIKVRAVHSRKNKTPVKCKKCANGKCCSHKTKS